ncbi:Slit 2 protein [Blomia tropicalis]|nr:Slit 2 protein [Blomia tropicalis]
MALTANSFYGLKSLKILHLDNNQLSCIEDESLNGLKELEILSLNQNNLTTIGINLLEGLKKLKSFRLSENPLICDCSLSWLGSWLRVHNRLGRATKCGSPYHLNGKLLADLYKRDFRCNTGDAYYDAFLQNDGTSQTCSIKPQCPFACSCQDGVVDCRNRNLTKIPDFIPENATELRLEQNSITEVPSRAFSNYRQLLRIDLSKNNISKIAEDAFHGLKSLNSLFLFGNEITDLPEAVFKGLSNIQVLFLNANRIKCLRRGIFADFKNLNLLSLYDNNIQSLAEGIFENLINIQTLHLGRNPFICDCNLRWLSEYLRDRPTLETSDARCEEPKRNNRKRFAQLHPDKFRCKGAEELRTRHADQCLVDNKCPKNCVCDGTIVDCSRQSLDSLPDDVPSFATELRLNDNRIARIPNINFFKRLPNLLKLDLRNNQLTEIEDGALQGAGMLQDLLLSSNQMKQIRPKMFAGLRNLTTLLLQDNQITCITNDTFSDLETLKILSINDNRIRCITSGAFVKTKQLAQLNLLSNPLNCNCHLRWFSNWIKLHTNVMVGNPRCHSPKPLFNVPIDDVENGDFKCDDIEEETECGPDGLCPARCTCTGNVVRCSGQKLKRFPRFIPSTTTELYLDANEITTIPSEIGQLSHLVKIDLSNNQISVLPSNMFQNLSNLQSLIMSYNKLQCIQSDAFKGLRSLRMLSLHGNDISMIPTGSFDDLKVTHLAIGANPFYCDCNLGWLAEWIQRTYSENGIARCSEPRTMSDKLLISAPPNHFICTGKPETKIMAKCDACYTFPCENGATCVPKPMLDYRCECTPGYHGPNCENKIDACFGNPCDNGGTCKVMEAGRFSCHCPSGYKGARCEIDIDECEMNKCTNNSTCIDDIGTYRCECLTGYHGPLCEKKIDYCSNEFNPCKNGECHVRNDDTRYECVCSNGWSGPNCTINVDDCLENMCQNSGTCIDEINGYRCECQLGYAGQFCEIQPDVDMLYPQTSPCQHHDCMHGVCFLPPGSPDYICKCSPGYTGKRCDTLSSINFRNGSYLEFEPLSTKPMLNITLKFVTRKTNGVLFYFGEQHHLAVELFKGRIRISLDVGNYPVSTMFSYETVSDGTYHQVQFELIRKNFTMRVDHGVPRTIINEGVREYLEIQNSSLFVGGLPDSIAHEAVRNWHIWNATSLEGCMREFYINGNPPDLTMARQQYHVNPGCVEFDEVNHACLNHMCQHGKCVPSKGGQSYECKCKVGYSGPFCDQAPTCQKEIKRDFYYEKTCRSTKKLKLAMCVGSCGDGCCKAQKTKKRSIKLACSDGSKYTKQIEVIRKCGCSRKC